MHAKPIKLSQVSHEFQVDTMLSFLTVLPWFHNPLLKKMKKKKIR